MSNVFTLRNCLVYLNYTFSFFNFLMPGGDKNSHIVKKNRYLEASGLLQLV